MIGSIISTAAGLGSTIVGQLAAQKQMAKAEEQLQNQRTNLRSWYDRSRGDALAGRADMVELARRTNEQILQNNRLAQNPVANRTIEGQNAMSDTHSMGQTAAAVSQAGAQQKAATDQQFLTAQNQLAQQEAALATGRAQQITQAAGTLTNGMMKSGSLFDKYFTGKDITDGNSEQKDKEEDEKDQ